MKMSFCPECGRPLHPRPHPTEPDTPFCERCGEYRFPVFSAAVAVILLDPSRSRILLIRQYGEPDPVLPAGYIDKGETAEAAVIRELREELRIAVRAPRFLGSHYYAPSETLMLNFLATAETDGVIPNAEVDAWDWVDAEKARDLVRRDGLARTLLDDWDGRP